MRWKIIKQFSSRNTPCFTLQDVVREFPVNNRDYLRRLLADMVIKGMLCRLGGNNYYIIPFNEEPESYVPNRYQLAKYLMQGKDYYIGYASALRIHGLTFKNAAREYVVTKNPMRPSMKSFDGIIYQFIQHEGIPFFGYSQMWINSLEMAMVSDLEKTIIDISSKPQLCGGIMKVGKALFLAQKRYNHDKLFYYFARNMNKSAKKRFLFLTELLGLNWTHDHEIMMKDLGTGISLLDPSEPNMGIKRSRFGLKINVDPAEIKKQVYSGSKY